MNYHEKLPKYQFKVVVFERSFDRRSSPRTLTPPKLK